MSAHMDGNTQDIIDYFVSDCWYNIYLGYNDFIKYIAWIYWWIQSINFYFLYVIPFSFSCFRIQSSTCLALLPSKPTCKICGGRQLQVPFIFHAHDYTNLILTPRPPRLPSQWQWLWPHSSLLRERIILDLRIRILPVVRRREGQDRTRPLCWGVCCVEGLAGGRERKKKTQWNKTVPKMKQNELPYIPTLTIYRNTPTYPTSHTHPSKCLIVACF